MADKPLSNVVKFDAAISPTTTKTLATSAGDELSSYTGLFGTIEMAEGLNARSVLSPAAYLVDLLQLKDSASDNGYHARRPDVGGPFHWMRRIPSRRCRTWRSRTPS